MKDKIMWNLMNRRLGERVALYAVGLLDDRNETKANSIEDLVLLPNTIKDQKFVFPDKIKRIKLDIGLSTEGTTGCQWLINNDDVGVIGIEANPICQRQLYYCSTNNSYITSLYLRKNKICQFVGFVSEVFLKLQVLGWDPSKHSFSDIPTNASFRLSSGEAYHVSPFYQINRDGNFRLLPVLREIRDIEGRYILLRGGVDNVSTLNPGSIVYQEFYSTHGTNNIGASSFRKDVIEHDPKKEITEILNVPCFSLDTVLDYVDWNKFSFIECIKIDVEGKELDVLKSCKKYIEKIVYFRIETFEKDDPANTTFCNDVEIIKFMNDKGFELFDKTPGDYKFVNKRYKNLIESQPCPDMISSQRTDGLSW